MNKAVGLALVIGLAVGSIAGALIAKARKPKEPSPVAQAPPTPAPLPAPVPPKEPDPEIARLQKKVAELEAKLAAAPTPSQPPAPEEPKEAALPDDLDSRFAKLAPLLEGAGSKEEFAKLLEQFKKGGAKSIEYLADKLLNGKTPGERFLAGAFLEGLSDPASVPALSKSLENDEAGAVRRMASHALAMLHNESALPALRAAMAGDKEWGVRVNSAYGVGKLGQPDGARTLEELYYSKESKPYLAAVFGAIADVASPTSVPFFRKILGESTEMSFQIGAIRALEKLKATEAVPDLNKIAGDQNYDVSVRDAARKAIESLSK